MMARLSNAGVTAGTAKCFQVLSSPALSATSEINPAYGNISRVIHTAASKASGCSPEAVSQTRNGASSTPSRLIPAKIQSSAVET